MGLFCGLVCFCFVFFLLYGLAQGQEGLTLNLGHSCSQRTKIELFLEKMYKKKKIKLQLASFL